MQVVQRQSQYMRVSPDTARFQAALAQQAVPRQSDLGYQWLTPGSSQTWKPFPAPPIATDVRFGLVPHPYCGVCPICVAGAAARMEVSKINEMRQGTDLDEDIEIQVGQASSTLRTEGKETGALVERTSIGNEDGTRLQPFSVRDLEISSLAALPRIYRSDNQSSYAISANPLKEEGRYGTNNGLYRAVIGGQVLTPEKNGETFSYSCMEGDPPPAPEHPQFPLLGAFDNQNQPFGLQIKTFGIYHHVAEGPEVRTSKHSFPLLLGYVSVSKPTPKELFVLSLRELPRFEHLGIEAGGLMNTLGLAAREGQVDAVSVLVEPWQSDLQDYIRDLQDKYRLPVTETRIGKASGDARDLANQLQVPSDSKLVRIDIGPLKHRYQQLSVKEGQGRLDTDAYTALLQSIALEEVIREDTAPSASLNREANCPSAEEITLFSPAGKPRMPQNELFSPVIPARFLKNTQPERRS